MGGETCGGLTFGGTEKTLINFLNKLVWIAPISDGPHTGSLSNW